MLFLIERGYILLTHPPAMTPLTQGMPTGLLPLLDEPLTGLMLRLMKRHGVKRVTLIADDPSSSTMLGDGGVEGVTVDTVACWEECDGEAAYILPDNVLTDVDLCRIASAVEDGSAEAAAWQGILAVSAQRAAKIPAGASAEQVSTLAEQDAVRAEAQGYFCRVEDPDSYRQAQADLLAGKVGLPVQAHRYGRAIIARNGSVPGDVRVTGRCFVGRGVRVGAGSILGQGTVIGSGAQIGGRCFLENACIMPDTRVAGDACLRNVLVFPRHGAADPAGMIRFSSAKS